MDGSDERDFQLNDDEQVNGLVRNLVYICPVDHIGTSVFVKGWLVPESHYPPLILVHDLGETALQMGPLAGKLAEAGFNVYSFDQRGHGQSGRRLGHIPGFNQLALDLLQVVAWVKHKEGGRKPVILGQGLGALVALLFARGHQKFCQALVLASPMMDLSYNLRPSQRLIIHTLAEFFPTATIPHWLCPQFTNDPRAEKKRGALHPKLSAFLANELLVAIGQARKLFERLSLPSLILTPANEQLYRYELLKKKIAKHKFADRVVLKTMESPHHRLFSSEPELTNQVASEMIFWLKALAYDSKEEKAAADEELAKLTADELAEAQPARSARSKSGSLIGSV